MIRENIEKIRSDIGSGKTVLIAVSKTKPVEMIREAYDCGIRDFGENKVQELLEKKPQLPEDIRWHLIGHLQTNKVRQIVGNVALIHSVDSLKLAYCIDAESAKKGIVTDALLEINVAGEESKHGFPPDCEALPLQELSELAHVRFHGLMTVAPDVDNPEDNRDVFRKLKALAVDIASKNIDNVDMNFLSMGMTGDYQVAVEEGADFIRVGTGIFGHRERMGK